MPPPPRHHTNTSYETSSTTTVNKINEHDMQTMTTQLLTASKETESGKGKFSALTHHLRLPRGLDANFRAASAIRDGFVFLLLLFIAAVLICYCSEPSRRVSSADEESLQEDEKEEYALPGPHIDADTRMHDTRTFYGWVRANNTSAQATGRPGEQQLQN